MGIRGTFRTGFALARRSVGLLREHPRLAVFPLLSALSLLVFFVGGVVALAVIVVSTGVSEAAVTEGAWWLGSLAVGYFVAAVLATYFNAGLVHEATRVLEGEAPSLRRGLAAGWRVRRKVLVWGLLSSALGVVLEVLETSDNRFAWYVSWLLQGSWAVLTFFVVPVMLFTDTDTVGMFEESGRAFEAVWGRSLTASLGIDLLALLAAVAVVAGTVALAAVGGPFVGVALLVGLPLLFAVLVARSAVHGVAKAALYQVATGASPDLLGGIDVAAMGSGERGEPAGGATAGV